MKTPRVVLLLTSLLLALPAVATAAETAATVVMLSGKATALGADGTVRKLAKNDSLYSGDLVNSGIGSYVNLKFVDGAFFLLRPETRFQIEQYRYAAPAPVAPAEPKPAPAAPLVTGNQQAEPASGVSRAFFRLVKGGFRSVSGLIGKLNHDNYRVITPVATIGIRGTSYSARLCDGLCEDRDQLVLQLDQAGKAVGTDETVLVTTVDEGGIELASSQATVIQSACNEAASAGIAADRCGALLVSTDGVVTVLPVRPSVEIDERSLDPKACY